MMSFLVENKLLLGAVGIALSSAAVGFVVSRGFYCKKSLDVPFKFYSEHSPVAKYVLEHGIREPSPLMKLRQVNNLYYFKLVTNSSDLTSHTRYLVCTFKLYIYLS